MKPFHIVVACAVAGALVLALTLANSDAFAPWATRLGANQGANATPPSGAKPATKTGEPGQPAALTASAHPAANTPGHRLIRELEAERDYGAFFERHRQRAAGASTLLAADLMDRCTPYYPGSISRLKAARRIAELPPARRADAQAALDELTHRCRHFTPQHFAVGEVFLRLRREAIETGEPLGRAYAITRVPPNAPPPIEQMMQEARSLARTRDPLVIAQLALVFPSVGPGAEWQFAGLPSPAPSSEVMLAWMLAACDAGADCGPQSVPVLAACVRGSDCRHRRMEDIVQAGVTDARAFERITIIRSAISAGIDRGEWPEGFWTPRFP